jgi:hypothetical protein
LLLASILLKIEIQLFFKELLEKGKPLERVGRKATGLSSHIAEYGSRVAGQT